MAAIFIAQATNVHLSLGDQLGILGVLLLTSKGAAAVTGGGFITLAATLESTGKVPVAGLALLLGIDRFMSEARAITNLIGNGVATMVVARWEGALDLSARCGAARKTATSPRKSRRPWPTRSRGSRPETFAVREVPGALITLRHASLRAVRIASNSGANAGLILSPATGRARMDRLANLREAGRANCAGVCVEFQAGRVPLELRQNRSEARMNVPGRRSSLRKGDRRRAGVEPAPSAPALR